MGWDHLRGLDRLRFLGKRIQVVALWIVTRFGRILSVLGLGFGRRLAQVVPELIRLGEVDLDLELVADRMRLEIGPSVALDERIILLGLVVAETLGLQLLLVLLRGRHRDGLC